MKFTIDRARWRNAGHGKGHVFLLNDEGYRCCLGFVEQQLGVSDDLLLDVSTPVDVGVENILARVTSTKGPWYPTILTRYAVKINDDSTIGSHEEREQLLVKLFQKEGYELEFVGEYEEPEKERNA